MFSDRKIMNSRPQENSRLLPNKIISIASNFFDSFGSLLIHIGISPNALTVSSLIVGMAAGLLFALHKPAWAAAAVFMCGFLDIMDGKVAELSDRKTLFGAILDSSLDRYSEFFIYLGIAYHFRSHWALWLIFFALLGSTMVSYTRARAEGLGIECRVGIMQRAERILLITLAAVIGSIVHNINITLISALVLITIMSNITSIQRIYLVRKIEKTRNQERRPSQ